MIEDCTKAEGGQGNAPEPNHAVEEVLFEVVILFSINGPGNDKAGKNEENNNIVLPVLRTNTVEVSAKKPIKIGVPKKNCDRRK